MGRISLSALASALAIALGAGWRAPWTAGDRLDAEVRTQWRSESGETSLLADFWVARDLVLDIARPVDSGQILINVAAHAQGAPASAAPEPNWDDALHRLGGDEKLLTQLPRTFQEQWSDGTDARGRAIS